MCISTSNWIRNKSYIQILIGGNVQHFSLHNTLSSTCAKLIKASSNEEEEKISVTGGGLRSKVYLWLTTMTPAIYINTVETTIPIKPSDALGSTPLTIRNIAMGNLLPMTKSVSRRDSGRRRRCRRRHRAERTVWPVATGYRWLLFITYMTILHSSPTCFRC